VAYESWYNLKPEEIPTNAPFSEDISLLVAGRTVLDVGCGAGNKATFIAGIGAKKVYGIDINGEAVEKAKRDHPSVEFIVEDAERMRFPDSFFDVVNIQGTLACLREQERSIVLNEVYRVLVPRGILHLSEFGLKEGFEQEYVERLRRTQEYGTDISYYADGTEKFWSHNFHREELKTLIKRAGFEICRYKTKVFPTISRRKKIWGHIFIAEKRIISPLERLTHG
jgi:ubiquinone/menaquinone biosynthesis C-methylase UbiE